VRFSRDAARVLFDRPGPLPGIGFGSHDVWVVNADGSGLRDLTPDNARYDYPLAWSYDGTKIAFYSYRYVGDDLVSGVFVMTPTVRGCTWSMGVATWRVSRRMAPGSS
jgi:Tol biopolymer transport system component